MSSSIKITIPLEGLSKGSRKIKVETSGFVGATCKSASEAILAALGSTQTEELKQEYFETESTVERLTETPGDNG